MKSLHFAGGGGDEETEFLVAPPPALPFLSEPGSSRFLYGTPPRGR